MVDAERLLTVLVVDDEALLRWSIATLLRQRGHTVIEAATADAARRALGLTDGPIDIVFLDYCLPDSKDLRLLEDTRRLRPESAAVLMTAFGIPEVLQGALDRGACCVLNKPFDMKDIEAVVVLAQEALQDAPGRGGPAR